jgi:hypothetical protein
MTALEIIKASTHVTLFAVVNGDLWYTACSLDASDKGFRFSVPKEDQLGATFETFDTKVIYYMRWIRKALAAIEEEKKMIDQAKEEWYKQ